MDGGETIPGGFDYITDATETVRIKPNDIYLAEFHDCFTIAELLATEDLGFADRGEGGLFAREG